MNFIEILEDRPEESERLEYKDKRADNTSIVKDLVALANNDGGTLFYGIRESNGVIEKIQNITDYSQFEEDISQTIGSRVDPVLPVEVRKVEYDGSTVVAIQVKHNGLLHTFDPGNSKPCIPMRIGSTTYYLDGAALREFYRSRFESADSGLAGWLDQVRKQAHRITYAYEKNDFSKSEERGGFAETVSDVAERFDTRLGEPHRELDEKTAQLIGNLVYSCDGMSSMQTRATLAYSLNGSHTSDSDYIGDSPEEIEDAFREKAEVVNEAAGSLKAHLED